MLQRWAEHGDVFQTQDTDNDPVDGTVTVVTTGETYFTVTTSASRLIRSYSLDDSLRCPGREGEPGNHLVGTAGPDLIGGTNEADVICGLAGRDKILGGAGPDLLLGGTGNDGLFGNAGRDVLIGGRGTDRCRGGRGNNTLTKCEG